MTSTRVVETQVTTHNSPFQDYTAPDHKPVQLQTYFITTAFESYKNIMLGRKTTKYTKMEHLHKDERNEQRLMILEQIEENLEESRVRNSEGNHSVTLKASIFLRDRKVHKFHWNMWNTFDPFILLLGDLETGCEFRHVWLLIFAMKIIWIKICFTM